MDLDAKLALSNKLVHDLKCENESLKKHAKCLIAEPIVKNEDNICCNHVVKPNFVPIVNSTSKDKLVYIPPHKRNHKVERKTLKEKPLFRSHPRDLNGSKFVSTCHHYGVISLPKRPDGPKHIVYHHYGAFSLLRPHCSKFQSFKRIKRKEKLELLGSCALQVKLDLGENGKLLKHVINALSSSSLCISNFHSFNSYLSSHETLTPNNCFVWARNSSYD